MYENIPLERSSHSAVIHQHQLIIFGGLKADKYVGSNLFTINLDIFDKKGKTFNNFIKRVHVNPEDIMGRFK
jgi:hypothetical protein